jgi:hypothetical protein
MRETEAPLLTVPSRKLLTRTGFAGFTGRLIKWVYECGYQIVGKDRLTPASPEPADKEQQRAPEYH